MHKEEDLKVEDFSNLTEAEVQDLLDNRIEDVVKKIVHKEHNVGRSTNYLIGEPSEKYALMDYPFTEGQLVAHSQSIAREYYQNVLKDTFGCLCGYEAGLLAIDDLLDNGFRFIIKKARSNNYDNSTSYKHEDADTNNSILMGYTNGSVLYHPEKQIYVSLTNWESPISRIETAIIDGKEVKSKFSKIYYRCFFGTKTQDQLEELYKLLNVIPLYEEVEIDKRKGKIGVLTCSRGNFDIRFKALKANPDLDLSKYYNDDFLPVNDLIIKSLSEQDSKGLVLLHGIKGSGKTSYIKWLSAQQAIGKNFVYMSLDTIHMLADPTFINFILNYPNTIIVIEDGEKIIASRETTGNNAVSNILNFSDGIMSDLISMQFIITFNTHISKIDEALLRKGRLIAEYEFKELATDKCKKLVAAEYEAEITKPMTLADILHYKSETGITSTTEKKKVGFGN